jgi:hypothetical protein
VELDCGLQTDGESDIIGLFAGMRMFVMATFSDGSKSLNFRNVHLKINVLAQRTAKKIKLQ